MDQLKYAKVRPKTFFLNKSDPHHTNPPQKKPHQMRIPLELEHLIKTDSNTPKTNLAGCLSVIDSRKALEVEHYLRACALRLDLTALPPSTTFH